jgi:hypothetical protein
MAILKFEPPKERAFLRVEIACDVHERVERYRAFCGALELTDLVERALVYVMDKDVSGAAEGGRHHSGEGRTTAVCEEGFPRRSNRRGPVIFLSHLMHSRDEPENATTTTA